MKRCLQFMKNQNFAIKYLLIKFFFSEFLSQNFPFIITKIKQFPIKIIFFFIICIENYKKHKNYWIFFNFFL